MPVTTNGHLRLRVAREGKGEAHRQKLEGAAPGSMAKAAADHAQLLTSTDKVPVHIVYDAIRVNGDVYVRAALSHCIQTHGYHPAVAAALCRDRDGHASW